MRLNVFQGVAADAPLERQFFRLVTSGLSVWHAKHSTANPLVELPDSVVVDNGDKFSHISA